jgi:hypothetical protein
MLRDKPRIIKVTLPALSSADTVTILLDDLKISPAEQAILMVFALATGNFSVAKSKVSGGNYKLVITASGSVSASTVVPLLCMAGGVDAISPAKDA